MAPDETTASGGEEIGVKLCPFAEGNDAAFPYDLSIHGAWMLQRGIEAYAKQAVAMHESGEDASYCLMMTHTAIGEARKLKEWAVRAAPDYLEGTVRDLDRLLVDLAAQSDRFAALASQEGCEGKAINLDDLFGGCEESGGKP